MRFISECLGFKNIIEAPDTIWWAAQVKAAAAMVIEQQRVRSCERYASLLEDKFVLPLNGPEAIKASVLILEQKALGKDQILDFCFSRCLKRRQSTSQTELAGRFRIKETTLAGEFESALELLKAQ